MGHAVAPWWASSLDGGVPAHSLGLRGFPLAWSIGRGGTVRLLLQSGGLPPLKTQGTGGLEKATPSSGSLDRVLKGRNSFFFFLKCEDKLEGLLQKITLSNLYMGSFLSVLKINLE